MAAEAKVAEEAAIGLEKGSVALAKGTFIVARDTVRVAEDVGKGVRVVARGTERAAEDVGKAVRGTERAVAKVIRRFRKHKSREEGTFVDCDNAVNQGKPPCLASAFTSA